MRLLSRLAPELLRLAVAGLGVTLVLGLANAPAHGQPVDSGACGLSQAAFCETFDQPAGTGNRSGQLNGTLWGVSRTTGNINLGQPAIDAWTPTTIQDCSGPRTVQPENDIILCNGQLREAVDDGHTV